MKANKIAEKNPKLLQALQNAGLITRLNSDDTEHFILPLFPQGVYWIERCSLMRSLKKQSSTTGQAKPDNSIKTNPSVSETRLKELETQVLQAVLNYQRNKSEWLLRYSERSQAGRAKAIKSETLAILYHNKNYLTEQTLDGGKTVKVENTKKKYQDILAVLEKHYLELTRAGIKSELRDSLQKILAAHNQNYEIEFRDHLSGYLINAIGSFSSVIGHTIKFLGRTAGWVGTIASSPFRLIGGLLNESIFKPVRAMGTLIEGIADFAVLPGMLLELAGREVSRFGHWVDRKSEVIVVGKWGNYEQGSNCKTMQKLGVDPASQCSPDPDPDPNRNSANPAAKEENPVSEKTKPACRTAVSPIKKSEADGCSGEDRPFTLAPY